MKKRHRRIQRKLDPKRQRASRRGDSISPRDESVRLADLFGAPEIFFAPVPKQQKPGRDRVKQAALRDEHREWNTFPGNRAASLVIEEFETVENLEAGHTTVEKETGHTERSAPTVKCIKGRERAKQSRPNQAAY